MPVPSGSLDKRHPTEMGPEEIQAFLSHLAVERRVARQSSIPKPVPPHALRNGFAMYWVERGSDIRTMQE